MGESEKLDQQKGKKEKSKNNTRRIILAKKGRRAKIELIYFYINCTLLILV